MAREPFPRLGVTGLGWAACCCLIFVLLAPLAAPAAQNDPLPSPLYRQSLRTSIERFTQTDALGVVTPVPQRTRSEVMIQGAGGSAISRAGASGLVQDCFLVPQSRIEYSAPFPPFFPPCSQPQQFNLSGQVVQQRLDPPPVPPIPIEIVSLNLVSISPISVTVSNSPPSQGSVDFAPNPTSILWWLEIRDPNWGPLRNQQPWRTTGSTSQFPQYGTHYQSDPQAPVPLYDQSGNERGCLSFFDIVFEVPCEPLVCVYRLTCASGDPSDLANLGLCIGDERIGATCVNTCAGEIRSKLNGVCLVWTLVGCQPSTAEPIPGEFGFCDCDPAAPTMPSSPTCPGEASCQYMASCQGTSTCPGFYTCLNATCAAIQTCQAVTCTAELTCAGSAGTCSPNVTCQYYPTCEGTITCRVETCVGWQTCRGSTTCHGAVTCPPPPTYQPIPECAQPTLQNQHTCHGSQTCQGWLTCASASCAASETCQDVPTCGSGITCTPFVATCAPRFTCPGNPSCDGTQTCSRTISTCIGFETCRGSQTCLGTPTCDAPPTLQGAATCQPTQCLGLSCVGQQCPPTIACDPSCAGSPCPTSIGAPSCMGGNCPTILGAVSCAGANCQTIGGVSCGIAACPTMSSWFTCRRVICVPPTMKGWHTCPAGSCATTATAASCLGNPNCQPTVAPTPSCGGVQTCTQIPCHDPTFPGDPSCAGTASCAANQTCSPFGQTCAGVATCPPAASCGGVTCKDQNTCPGFASCPGTATCPRAHTCAPNPTCRNVQTCDGVSATCAQSPTCHLSAQTCAGWPTCNGSPTCTGQLTCGQATCDLTCGPGLTCDGSPTCPTNPTCNFEATCADWPTCQPPSFGTHNKALMISRVGRSYDSFFDVFFDITVTDDWHEGPLSSLLVIDPNQFSGVEPEPFADHFFDVFHSPTLDAATCGPTCASPPKAAGGVESETLYVNTQLPDGQIIDHRDENGDGVVSLGDYLLVEYTDGESVWYIVVATGTNGGAKDAAAVVDYFEMAASIPPPLPSCVCAFHGDPNKDGTVVDILDVVETVNRAFRGFPALCDADCPAELSDVDCSGFTDVLDVVGVVNVAFRGFPLSTFCNPCATPPPAGTTCN